MEGDLAKLVHFAGRSKGKPNAKQILSAVVVKTLKWVLDQDEFLLVEQSVHCIAVDGKRSAIMDCSRKEILPLSIYNLSQCGIMEGDVKASIYSY